MEASHFAYFITIKLAHLVTIRSCLRKFLFSLQHLEESMSGGTFHVSIQSTWFFRTEMECPTTQFCMLCFECVNFVESHRSPHKSNRGG